MDTDLAFLRERVVGYAGYGDEAARHASDKRVRAFVGEALADVQAASEAALDGPTQDALSATLLRCEFGDMQFIRRLDHAALDARESDALVRADRGLVELAERARGAAPADLPAIVAGIRTLFDRRELQPD
ncbi:MAG: hypothetical protein ACREM2_10335 [Vulcanimicrobiaceae bacterium]